MQKMIKARFYEVTCRDGKGEWLEYYPDQSADHLLPKIERPHVKITIRHIGFHSVNVSFSSREEYSFRLDINGKSYSYELGTIGYDYLNQYCSANILGTEFPDDF